MTTKSNDNSFPNSKVLPFEQGGFTEWLLSIPEVSEAWTNHTNHPFILHLGAGTLPTSAFKSYLIQDYHFLTHYARLICILASKAPSTPDVFRQAEYAVDVKKEMELHINYCKEFGLAINDILTVPQHDACTTYVEFLKDIANQEDWISLQIALSPCMLGYKVIGEFLINWAGTKKDSNPYWSWIDQYSGIEYGKAVEESLSKCHPLWFHQV
jgi:thiaminase